MSFKIHLAPTFEAQQRKPRNFDELRPLEPSASQLGRMTLEGIAVGFGLATLVWLGALAASFLGAR